MSKLESVTNYFDRTAPAFIAKYSTSPAFRERLTVWNRAIGKILACLPRGALCLDMGCGSGLISRRIAAAGVHIVGIDQSEAMLALARRQAADEGISAQAEYVLATLPLSDELSKAYVNSADLIISSSVMEYVDNYEKAIRQFHSILKHEGILLLSLPNQLSIYRVFERMLQKLFPLRDSYLQHQRHQFNPVRAKSLLISLGFEVIEEEYFSLPWQRFFDKFLRGYRGRWLATMFLFTVRKT